MEAMLPAVRREMGDGCGNAETMGRRDKEDEG
jgi:hypothetical protein